MTISILGGAFFDSKGEGSFPTDRDIVFSSEELELPKGRTVFRKLPGRYGRFDGFTRLGVLCATRALQACGLSEKEEFCDSGIIISSRYECYQTDLKYYETTREEGGAFTSPQMFSYTLPGLISGELAICHKLTGPTFNISEDGTSPGTAALKEAVSLLQSGICSRVLTGFVEYPPEEWVTDSCYGAAFLLLSKEGNSAAEFSPESLCSTEFLNLFKDRSF